MNQIVSNLLVYGQLPEDSILWQLSDICEKLKNGSESKDALRTRVFGQVKNLLTVATDFAFDKNLWHNYLTFLLITNENPFSIVCEKMGAQEGTVNCFVKHDFEVFMKLFDYDFSWIEEALSIEQIASAVGFSGQSAFCRAFLQKHGITPTQYRAAKNI